MGVWEAMELSRKAVTKRWFSCFFLMIIMAFILAVGTVLTFGIGAIWLGPWGILVFATLYRNVWY